RPPRSPLFPYTTLFRSEEASVTLRGEVKFPGTYAIRANETLSSVIERAGGLTSRAFPEGSVFTRQELREREREQLQTLARRLERSEEHTSELQSRENLV